MHLRGGRFSPAPSVSVTKATEDPLLGDRTELGETCSYQTLSGSWAVSLSGAGEKSSPVPRQRGSEAQHKAMSYVLANTCSRSRSNPKYTVIYGFHKHPTHRKRNGSNLRDMKVRKTLYSHFCRDQ